jgi:hypothetical protein
MEITGHAPTVSFNLSLFHARCLQLDFMVYILTFAMNMMFQNKPGEFRDIWSIKRLMHLQWIFMRLGVSLQQFQCRCRRLLQAGNILCTLSFYSEDAIWCALYNQESALQKMYKIVPVQPFRVRLDADVSQVHLLSLLGSSCPKIASTQYMPVLILPIMNSAPNETSR